MRYTGETDVGQEVVMHRKQWTRLVLMAMTIAALLLPGRSFAAAHPAASPWQASAALFTLAGGQWRSATSVDSLDELRGVLTVRGQGVGGRGVAATMALRHLSWQGFQKVVMPPTVTVPMRRAGVSGRVATFTAQVTIPTDLPVYWTVVDFVVSGGGVHAETTSGVMVGGAARRTAFNTLTVPRARAFCAVHSPLPYLSYAVYLHGYFVGIFTGGDGPPQGMVLDRPRHVTSSVLQNRAYTHGIRTGGFGLPRSAWGTVRGLLGCAYGEPTGFGAYS